MPPGFFHTAERRRLSDAPASKKDVLPAAEQTFTPFSRPVDIYYRAFNNAESLPFVQQALSLPLQPLLGVKLSDPLPVDIPCGKFRELSVALSAEGVFFFHDHGESTLHAYHLATRRHVCVRDFPNWSFVAAHGGSVFVGQWQTETLLEARVADVLRTPTRDAFREHRIPTVYSPVARTDLAPRAGRVVYSGPNWRLVELDLVTRATTVHDELGEVTYVSSLTGVDAPGQIALVSSGYSGEFAYGALDVAWRLTPFGNLEGPATTTFPSETAPHDMRTCLILDSKRNMYHGGCMAPLPGALRPRSWQSFVRVVNDVFLFFNDASKTWAAVRISVP
eukprot:gnl/Chilomastix_cuspidata/3848.p1 GENE.gnl/Chilomastix_cuspidata/3848~~gnl/Chilomastix_cuspidata/3848.p1  ORF type:complete len:335 (-),score=136.64 gnl/Chilomastix_cuspidata/3848:28-1032(-)